MSVLYDKKIFSEVFDSLKVHDEYAEIVEYTVLDKFKLRLDLYISTYDDYATVTLMRNNREGWIFDIGIEHLDKIIYEKNALSFYKNDNVEKPALTITIKPEISLWCRVATPSL